MVSGEDLRTAMREFTTGVTLLTTLRDDGSVKAMTANSVTSISLDPPIVLVCVGHGRNTHQHIESTGRYGINVLADDQAPAAEYFANEHMRSTGPDPVEYTMTERGSPKVIGSIAFLDCEVVGSHPYGDHTIFVGEVMDGRRRGRRAAGVLRRPLPGPRKGLAGERPTLLYETSTNSCGRMLSICSASVRWAL